MTTSSRQPVVAVLSDGTRRKGMIDAFHPSRTRVRMQEVDLGGHMLEIHDLDMHDVLALFFVRDLAIHRTHRLMEKVSPSSPAPHDAGGTKVRIQFTWGEVLDGVVYEAPSGRFGAFFLYPLGPLGRAYNILRCYVTRGAVARIEVIDSGTARRVVSL